MLVDDLKAEAYALGFSLVGVTTLQPPPHLAAYQNWLAKAWQADMDYLARQDVVAKRANPALLLPGARSMLCLAMSYPAPKDDPPASAGCGQVAAYARGKDYHLLIPPLLDELVSKIEGITGRAIIHKGYTDTAPILERDLAQRAGLGWIGKNTCLIHPENGSFFFLAEVPIDLDLEPDPPFAADRCGTCTKCIQACPTGCIQPDRSIDARRCIAFLTIENKGIIPRDLRPHMGQWIFGCDVCQIVCPWNNRTKTKVREEFLPLISTRPNLLHELTLSPGQFNQRFRNSPIQRAKRCGYLRNVAVALGNQPDPDNLPALSEVLAREPEALVRAHALWAVQQIHSPAARQLLDRVRSTESDPLVVAEFKE